VATGELVDADIPCATGLTSTALVAEATLATSAGAGCADWLANADAILAFIADTTAGPVGFADADSSLADLAIAAAAARSPAAVIAAGIGGGTVRRAIRQRWLRRWSRGITDSRLIDYKTAAAATFVRRLALLATFLLFLLVLFGLTLIAAAPTDGGHDDSRQRADCRPQDAATFQAFHRLADEVVELLTFHVRSPDRVLLVASSGHRAGSFSSSAPLLCRASSADGALRAALAVLCPAGLEQIKLIHRRRPRLP
jgi:hypothetical protein